MRRLTDPRYALLPLRAFVGFVFCYSAVSKIADPRFLDASAPQSMYASIGAVRATSPIGGLLGPVQAHSSGFGLALAVAEMAVGVGVLAGLFTRVAAAGGMLISLILWLTVSWDASPWFTSADLVYLLAMTPLLLAGASVLSLDAWLGAATRRRRAELRTPGDASAEDRTRRALVGVGVALLAATFLGVSSLFRSRRRTGAPSQVAPQALVAAAQVPVGGATAVTIASTGDPGWVLQLRPGVFTAVDARCPHQGCTVLFLSASAGFECPCHHSRFRADGSRISGPAPTGLQRIPVRVVGQEVRTS